jgi:hypothetical protein
MTTYVKLYHCRVVTSFILHDDDTSSHRSRPVWQFLNEMFGTRWTERFSLEEEIVYNSSEQITSVK